MDRIRNAIRRYLDSWSTVDPAVALGLFGTGVGLPPRDFPVT